MYGVSTLPSTPQTHGMSAMDAAANTPNASERGYFRPGLRAPSPAGQMTSGGYRPSTAASGHTTPMANRSNSNVVGGAGVSSTGLIRLTLKKPMGIVFEPMADPHNPSQQRGVRICDLPRTGAAAMSGKLEIGDELLSINNKTMSRLTFDEIMDFIIEAHADNVQLLFRRPKKDAGAGAAMDSAKRSSNVKWVDSKDKKVVTEVIEPDPDPDQETVGDETISTRSSSPPHRNKGKKKKESAKTPNRDEESIYSGDETFYTETTDFTEETRQKAKRGRRGNKKMESESFLDMLIDSLCAPVIGESGRGKNDDFSDDDETYTSGKDDDTYGTYDDDSYVDRKKKWDVRKRKEKERKEKSAKRDKKSKQSESEDDFKENVPFEMNSNSRTKSSSFEPASINDNYEEEQAPRPNVKSLNQQAPPPPPPPPPPASFGNEHQNFQRNQFSQMNNNMNNNVNNNVNTMNNDANLNMNMMNNNMNMLGIEPQNRFEPNLTPKNDITEMSLTPDPNCPIVELEYDDQVDHAADVSVMDSIGGPSLLLENLRNASKIVKTVTPEVIQKHGVNYPQELGLTREESIQVDPNKFYRWVVKNLLETHEPEKIRLIDKLFEKYKGREEHLIHKLSARYVDDEEKSKKSGSRNGSTEDDGEDYDGFKAFGGSFSKSDSTKETGTKGAFENSGWPSTIGEEEEEEAEEETQMNTSNDEMASEDMSQSQDYSESDYESVDGTSPEVIAKVSELLNYVYGKTSVPGQIDRVSTIMRAYEGRTGVLLELLETKALLKANADTENNEAIPDSLRENPGLKTEEQKKNDQNEILIQGGDNGEPMMSPISNITGGSDKMEKMMDSNPPTPAPMPVPESSQSSEEDVSETY